MSPFSELPDFASYSLSHLLVAIMGVHSVRAFVVGVAVSFARSFIFILEFIHFVLLGYFG